MRDYILGLYTGILLTDLSKAFNISEKLRKAIDEGLYTGILLTDLSKAFDCLSHDLLVGYQRTRINESFS